jgi:predicted nucleic acid-binding protein
VTPIFADASYYVALLSPRDQHHQAAVRISSELRRLVVVTEFVLIEVANALAAVESRERAAALWTHLRSDATVAIIPASADLAARGLELFQRRLDKQWSLTDCISFVVMNEMNISESLTADHHFEQAGFTAMLTH